MDHHSGRVGYEKNVPTEQRQAKKKPWLSGPHGNEERSSSVEPQTRERSRTVDAVTRNGEVVAAAPHGFSRRSRLARPAEYGRVFKRPARSSDEYFTVLATPREGVRGARLGLAISKRAARQAVQRNRLKRIAREAFRLQQALPDADFVVLAGAAAKAAPSARLRASLDRHFARLAARYRAKRHG